MRRTPTDKPPLPSCLLKYTIGAQIFDSSCSPEAKVYFIDGKEPLYLKRAETSTLESEAKMTNYFHSIDLGVEVLEYLNCDGYDWMLTRAARGEDCTHSDYLSDPKRLARLLGEELRRLHSVDPFASPIQNRLEVYNNTVIENYKKKQFDLSYLTDSQKHLDIDGAFGYYSENAKRLKSDTLIHGDYCLPNVLLDEWRLSAFIDLGNSGVGDRHIDIFWGAWTLKFNLGTDEYREDFLSAYGKDVIDESLIDAVSEAEVFG
jgi:kanamycin kinase